MKKQSGGWLLFYKVILWLFVLSGSSQTFFKASDQFLTVIDFTLILFYILFAIGIYVLRRTGTMARTYHISLNLILAVFFIGIGRTTLTIILGSYFLAWAGYWYFSKRVKNTYFKETSDPELAE